MKIVFLTQTYPRFEGDTSGPFIRDLARGLVAAGDEVTVLTPHTRGIEARWNDGDLDIRSFRYAPQSMEVVGYSRSLSSDERLKWRAVVATPLYLAGARKALREAVEEIDPDLVHGHWVVPNGLVAAAADLPKAFGIGLHGSDVFLAEKPIVRTSVSRSLRRAAFLTGCSPELVDRVCALGFDRSKATVIPYGVDIDKFCPDPDRSSIWRKKLGIPIGSVVVLTVGRMVTKKGFHVLLPAVEKVLSSGEDVHVILAGGGDRLEELKAKAARISERIHFPDAVLRDTLPDLYRTADLFVLPAVHDAKGNVDGLPNVILEAMATGLPIVATEISGIPLAVENEHNGLLVAEGGVAPLERALRRLIRDPNLRVGMGSASRSRAEAELSWTAIAGRYRQAYLRALAGARGQADEVRGAPELPR